MNVQREAYTSTRLPHPSERVLPESGMLITLPLQCCAVLTRLSQYTLSLIICAVIEILPNINFMPGWVLNV